MRSAKEDVPCRKRSEEKQLTKRKRNIMNHMQISMIENALKSEPDMQRKAACIQLWAEKISHHGSEISSSQLKNWLNNRKAKLARAAAKDVQAPSGGDNKQGGSETNPVSDSPESPDDFFDPTPSAAQGTQQNRNSKGVSVKPEKGQYVVLTDGKGEEIGKGCVRQSVGAWFGTNLYESGLCVVDVTYLKVTGASFGHSGQIYGVKRVLWDSSKLVLQ